MKLIYLFYTSKYFIMNLSLPPTEFEEEFVTNVYSKIAEHFDKTRYHTWPKIKEFIDSVLPNNTIYDIGCGNGRNMNIRDDCKFIGCDNNLQLLEQARKKTNKNQYFYGCNLALPFDSLVADAVLSIAVIHHFSTYERRTQAISELFRILKVGGKALIYVWAYEQEKFNGCCKNTFLDWNDQISGNIYKRYYYLFNDKELDNMVTNNFTDIQIIDSGIQCGNYFVICEKLK